MPSTFILLELCLLRLKAMEGTVDIDLNTLFENHENYKAKWLFGHKTNIIAEILLRMDDQHLTEAEEWILKAIDTNTRYNTRFWLGQSYRLYSDIFKKQNNLPRTREQLNKAIEIMKECGADGWVERYEKELTES